MKYLLTYMRSYVMAHAHPRRSCATRGGITDAIGDALVAKAEEIRSFLNYGNGSVIALSQTCFVQPYAFLPRSLLWQVCWQLGIQLTGQQHLIRLLPLIPTRAVPAACSVRMHARTFSHTCTSCGSGVRGELL